MSLYSAYFFIEKADERIFIRHNCNGEIGFAGGEEINSDIERLILFAIEEGKRLKSKEIRQCLYIK